MKKFLFALATLGLMSSATFAQNVLNLTRSVGDTIWVQESQVLRVTKTSTGSLLEYFNGNGDYTSTNIRERAVDTGNVASTVVITFAGSAGSIDSITINGVEIMGGSVAYTSSIATTVGLVEDSIDNQTQSPVNFSASNVGAILTISAPAAFGDTANGYEVVVYTTTITATPSTTTMTGGFTIVRNILTMSDRLFNVQSGAYTWNADRCNQIKKTSTGSVVNYEGSKLGQFSTTDTPAEITAAIKAL